MFASDCCPAWSTDFSIILRNYFKPMTIMSQYLMSDIPPSFVSYEMRKSYTLLLTVGFSEINSFYNLSLLS